MLSILFIGFCCYLSFQVTVGVHKQKDIFTEFKQRNIIIWAIWLVPVGAAIATFLPFIWGWLFPYLISAICFGIVAYESKCRNSAFQLSGTNRTASALKVLELATLTTIVGFIYLGVNLVFIIIKIGSTY